MQAESSLSIPPSPDNAPQALIDQIRQAAREGRRLRVQGGGTKSFLQPADDEAQALDLRSWSGIVSHEPTELVLTAKAGTPLTEVDAALRAAGQYLPFDPPRFGDGTTVGGAVAAGLAGPGRASVGGARDYVLGVQMLDGRGDALTFGGQVMKNVAGYDVSRAMAGSRGRLGVITEVSLKVLPVPLAEATLVFQLTQSEALMRLNRWGGQPLPLDASCWVRDDTAPGAPELLFLRLRGAVAAVESACERLLKEIPGGQRMDREQAAGDWALCRDHQLPFFVQSPHPEWCLWRLSVPQTAPALDLPYAQLIEWHGAQRWCWAPVSAARDLRDKVAAVKGHAQLFRAGSVGDGGVARDDAVAPVVQVITDRLCKAFDPHGVFQPARAF